MCKFYMACIHSCTCTLHRDITFLQGNGNFEKSWETKPQKIYLNFLILCRKHVAFADNQQSLHVHLKVDTAIEDQKIKISLLRSLANKAIVPDGVDLHDIIPRPLESTAELQSLCQKISDESNVRKMLVSLSFIFYDFHFVTLLIKIMDKLVNRDT